jgi:hypothetical protein
MLPITPFLFKTISPELIRGQVNQNPVSLFLNDFTQYLLKI